MSDDAVVILETKNPDYEEGEFEYRVAYVSNLENLYGIFNPITGKWSGDSGILLDLYAEKDVYINLDAAMDTAFNMIGEIASEPEFGIMVMKDFRSREFYDL